MSFVASRSGVSIDRDVAARRRWPFGTAAGVLFTGSDVGEWVGVVWLAKPESDGASGGGAGRSDSCGLADGGCDDA
jgi:hypothetical protein